MEEGDLTILSCTLVLPFDSVKINFNQIHTHTHTHTHITMENES